MSNTEQATTVARVTIKLPPFWKLDPELWFAQIEAQFVTANVVSDATKYYYVVGTIESDILSQVADLIKQPPAHNKYQALKARLVTQFGESNDNKLKRLLHGLELGDRKPSHLLQEM